ncbi:glycosyltransferase N-terminal domain-containing protein [Echinicola jeungdonensis]|uniref:3-deoxy-D-manno-octulosonic acid transferase n=1 Tax=Echinicola jeungdonensis TaxID=709343 RepID=UPI0025B52737|nr:glycosyltransferase N-terminal domain-containing protein [Echinicola jeungdonensis]MDN3669613.1 glycosyltransferase N-terminal domain-containing protein [Echinicola jeungdonensis]
MPFDTKGNARRFLDILQPKAAFFVKYDLWANFIFEAKKREIPLFLFSASFRKSQIYFKPYGGFFRKLLRAFDHIFTQNQDTLSLLNGIGVGPTTMTGDTRYDNVYAISQHPKKFSEIAEVFDGKPTIVVGSAWQQDMEMIIPFINRQSNYNLIIAPHDIHHQVIGQWQADITKKTIKYSELKGKNEKVDVLFIDNIGMLSSLYQFGRLAYVGGAMGKGLHNILEPLAFQIPVIFGKLKNNSKFPEAGISQKYGCGFMVDNAQSFEKIILDLENQELYQKAVNGAKKLVDDNLGSAHKIVAEVQKTLK